MIKNRFYGTLRNFIRFLVTRTDDRNESFNQLISKLSPKILNDIYKADNRICDVMQSSSSLEMKLKVSFIKCALKLTRKCSVNVFDRIGAFMID